jgi:CubicO group peptidase (beta-lactamase class C family)
MRRLLPLAAASLLAGSGGVAVPPPPSAAAAAYDFSAAVAEAERAVAEVPLRGAALLVVSADSVLLARGFGEMDTDTPVPVASASKWPAALLVMSLVGDGTLSLDDPVGRWIADVPADKRAITLRQLFSHTSGLPGSERGGGGRDAGGCLADRRTTLADCADQILALPLASAPGTEFRYGGVSMQVAGRVAEVAGGQSWSRLWEARIAGPLELTATTFGRGRNPRVAGGMVSTGREYARLLQMALGDGVWNGRRILPAAAVAEMERDQTRGARIVFSPHARYTDHEVRYGIGVWRDRVGADGRALQVSSQGAFGFSPWIDRERGIAGVFVTRNALPRVYARVAEVQRHVRQAVDAARGR